MVGRQEVMIGEAPALGAAQSQRAQRALEPASAGRGVRPSARRRARLKRDDRRRVPGSVSERRPRAAGCLAARAPAA